VVINPETGGLPSETAETTIDTSEKSRDEIIVKKKIVEVIEEYEVTAEAEKTGNSKMLVIIAGAVVAILLITAVVMTIRFCASKDKQVKESVAQTKFKSETAEIEPQFVLAADDSKNIFGTAGISAIDDAIESADGKKPSTRKAKKSKRVVVRKINKNAGSPASPVEEEKHSNSGDEADDGFNNHGQNFSPDASMRSPDHNSSQSRFFNTNSRDSNAKMLSTGSVGVSIKLRNMASE